MSTKNINKPIMDTETESVINALATRRDPSPQVFTVAFYKAFQVELTPIFHKFFKTIERESNLPNSLNETNITLKSKQDRFSTERANYR